MSVEDPFKFDNDPFAPTTPEAHSGVEVARARLDRLSGSMGAVAEQASVRFGGDTAGSVLDRASQVVRVAEHIPGLGKYADIARSVVDIGETAHQVAGQVNEHGAAAVGGNYLREVARAAAEAAGAQVGIEVGPDGKPTIKPRKFARGVFGLAQPKKLARTIAGAAATGAREAASQIPHLEAQSDWGQLPSAAEAPAFDWSQPPTAEAYDPFGFAASGSVEATAEAYPDPFSQAPKMGEAVDPFAYPPGETDPFAYPAGETDPFA